MDKDDPTIPSPDGASLLTDKEQQVVNLLAEAWNQFLLLPVLHDDHIPEFRHGVHKLQNLVMARPVQAEFHEMNRSR